MTLETRPALKVHDYFIQGFRRSRNPLLPVQGTVRQGSGNIQAQFSLDIRNRRVHTVAYKCSTCVVLVAYCELLAELTQGHSLAAATVISPAQLIQAFPAVPGDRHDRAHLAADALRSAIGACQCATPKPAKEI